MARGWLFPDRLPCKGRADRAALLPGTEQGPEEFVEAGFGSTQTGLRASEHCPIIEPAAWGDGVSELSIFGNVLAEPGWPSVVGIVERFMHLVDEQNCVDDDDSCECDCSALSADEVPGTAGQAFYPLSSLILPQLLG